MHIFSFVNSRKKGVANCRHAERDTRPVSRVDSKSQILTAVKQHDALYNREPQPGTARGLGTRRVDAGRSDQRSLGNDSAGMPTPVSDTSMRIRRRTQA